MKTVGAFALTAGAVAGICFGGSQDSGPMRITEERIRAAAEATLDHWPAAGIWPRHLPLLDLADLNPHDIDLTFISDADIRRHRNRLGRLGCALARDARPIAGRWQPPDGLKEPAMDQQMHLQGIAASLDHFGQALTGAFHILRTSAVGVAQGTADRFVNRTADAAGHPAKAMLVRGGHQPRRIHDPGDPADDIAGGNPELAEAIRSLNGHTRADHTGQYADAPPATADVVVHALRRLQRTGRLLAAELPHWRDEGLDALVDRIAARRRRADGGMESLAGGGGSGMSDPTAGWQPHRHSGT